MGGDLNCFLDIKLFRMQTWWGIPRNAHGYVPISVIECAFYDKIIYGFGVGI